MGSTTRRALRAMAVLALLMSALTVGLAPPASAADPSQVVIIVLDLSGSMEETLPDGRTKLAAAKEGLTTLVKNLPDGVNVGFWVYGDQFPSAPPASDGRRDNCLRDARRVAPVQPLDRDALSAQIAAFAGKGDTPVSLALTSSVADIPQTAQGTIVLVSDGRDECFDADRDGNATTPPTWGESPCSVAEQLKNAGVAVRLGKIETVGFLTDALTAEELKCIARVTGGSFTPIESSAELAPKITEIVTAAGRAPQRLGGTAVVGGDAAPTALALAAGPSGVTAGRYTDSLQVGADRWYRLAIRDGKLGVYSVTVFGLPTQEGIILSATPFADDGVRELSEIAALNKTAGIGRVGADSTRETITVSGFGDDAEILLRVRLESTQPLPTKFDTELTFEGEMFGGDPTGCPETAVCGAEARTAIAQAALAPLEKASDEAKEKLAKAEAALSAAGAEQTRLRAARDRFIAPAAVTGLAALVAAAGLMALFLSSRRRRLAVVVADPNARAVIGSLDAEPDGTIPVPHAPSASGVEYPIDGTTMMSEPVASGFGPAGSTDASVLWSPETVLASDSAPPGASDSPPIFAMPEPTVLTPDPAVPEPTVLAPVPAGWFDDPSDASRLRYWDGQNWTEHQSPKGGQR